MFSTTPPPLHATTGHGHDRAAVQNLSYPTPRMQTKAVFSTSPPPLHATTCHGHDRAAVQDKSRLVLPHSSHATTVHGQRVSPFTACLTSSYTIDQQRVRISLFVGAVTDLSWSPSWSAGQVLPPAMITSSTTPLLACSDRSWSTSVSHLRLVFAGAVMATSCLRMMVTLNQRPVMVKSYFAQWVTLYMQLCVRLVSPSALLVDYPTPSATRIQRPVMVNECLRRGQSNGVLPSGDVLSPTKHFVLLANIYCSFAQLSPTVYSWTSCLKQQWLGQLAVNSVQLEVM